MLSPVLFSESTLAEFAMPLHMYPYPGHGSSACAVSFITSVIRNGHRLLARPVQVC